MKTLNPLLLTIFYIFLALPFGSAIFIVMGQAVAIVTSNPGLAVWCKKLIALNARFGAGLSITNLIMGYLNGWMKGKKEG